MLHQWACKTDPLFFFPVGGTDVFEKCMVFLEFWTCPIIWRLTGLTTKIIICMQKDFMPVVIQY